MITQQPEPHKSGVARVISKFGIASRTTAAMWVRAGRVHVNGRLVSDPEYPVCHGTDCIALDGIELGRAKRVVIMLNKPRGLVTSVRDELARDTVYSCLQRSNLPWLAPVGRLDKASEGLLLFTNDPKWSAQVTHPDSGTDKKYHVHINRMLSAAVLAQLERGLKVDGELLHAKRLSTLRSGAKNSWLEITLSEGRNRQIRRLLAAVDVSILRLIRVAIGPLALGDLRKGQWRELSEMEIDSVSGVSRIR